MTQPPLHRGFARSIVVLIVAVGGLGLTAGALHVLAPTPPAAAATLTATLTAAVTVDNMPTRQWHGVDVRATGGGVTTVADLARASAGDLPCHFVIDAAGGVTRTRLWERQLDADATFAGPGVVAVVLLGDADTLTRQQVAAATALKQVLPVAGQ